ncbi:MAG: YoaK family protein [Eubacteriales bacterium]|nr:YoaK family protein [Eubacteriales bacterium]
MAQKRQISESLQLGIVLALAGGFMDAYSYVCRGHVFANAQTGNILLFGISMSEGYPQIAARYAMPVIAFAFGIAIAATIRHYLRIASLLHWRQISVTIEIVFLCSVAFMPQSWNLLANSVTSLACGIQVQSFRKINGNGMATTMCIGNLRTATQALCDYWHTKDKAHAEKAGLFYGIIVCFAAGAIIGNKCVEIFAEKAIIGSAAFLAAGFFIMFIDREQKIKDKGEL